MSVKYGSRGFTAVELTVVVACAGLLLALVVPTAGQVRHLSGVDVSVSNLQTLGMAHVLYTADWSGMAVHERAG